MDRPTAAQLTELWGLSTMPTENVAFVQTYVDAKIGPDGKPLCTAIIAMVTDDPETFSDLHTLPTDELWHFYRGDPLHVVQLVPHAPATVHVLSPDQLNTYDVLHADDVVFSVEALDSYISANTEQEVSA